MRKGPCQFSPAGDNEWTDAELNRPLTRGDRLWTDRRSRAEIQIGSSAVRLDGQTHIDIMALDDRAAQLSLTQGTVYVRVRSLPEGENFEIDTPNLAYRAAYPGDYRIDVDAGRRHHPRDHPFRHRRGVRRRRPRAAHGRRAADHVPRPIADPGHDAGVAAPGCLRPLGRRAQPTRGPIDLGPLCSARGGGLPASRCARPVEEGADLRRGLVSAGHAAPVGRRTAKATGNGLRRGAGPGSTMRRWGFAPFHYGRWALDRFALGLGTRPTRACARSTRRHSWPSSAAAGGGVLASVSQPHRRGLVPAGPRRNVAARLSRQRGLRQQRQSQHGARRERCHLCVPTPPGSTHGDFGRRFPPWTSGRRRLVARSCPHADECRRSCPRRRCPSAPTWPRVTSRRRQRLRRPRSPMSVRSSPTPASQQRPVSARRCTAMRRSRQSSKPKRLIRRRQRNRQKPPSSRRSWPNKPDGLNRFGKSGEPHWSRQRPHGRPSWRNRPGWNNNANWPSRRG